MIGRGEHAEIVSFVGKTVDSELSGNMIDVCPVGALTSKPFRYAARTWELSRRKSVSPHDSLGSNLIVQVKDDRVMRVLPLENEAINECWLSDKDRFSYEGLNAADRLTHADGQAGRRVEASRLADGARVRRARPAPTSSARTARCARRARVAALDARGAARSRRRSCAASAATTSTSACARPISRPTAGCRACRGSACRSPSSRRSTACSSSAASCARTIRSSRSACARRRSRGAQVIDAALGRRRLADATCAQGDRAAVELCALALAAIAVAAAKGAAVPRRARAASSRRRGEAIAASLASGQERRDPPRQLRRSSIRDASQLHALAQRVAEIDSARRSASWPRPRTASARTSRGALPQSGGMNAAGDARRAAQGLPAAARRARVRLRAIRVAARDALRAGGARGRAHRRSEHGARTTPTCCCRSRRSPRPPAVRQLRRPRCRASTAS